MADSSTVCFVIAPFGQPGSRTRQLADQTLRHIIEPAVALAGIGHTVVRADHILANGHINAQVMSYLVDAPIAVADLTGLNPNVMYELAVRHCSGRPVCQIADHETDLPFDVAGLRTLFFDLTNPDRVVIAKTELAGLLQNCLRDRPRSDSPLTSVAFASALTDEQTQDLVRLHMASAAFRIYRVIDATVTDIEEGGGAFDPEDFYIDVRNALLESRHLCVNFDSRRLGNLFQLFESLYPAAELRSAIDGALRIILSSECDANAKRKKLLAYLQNQQLVLDGKLAMALRVGEPGDRPGTGV